MVPRSTESDSPRACRGSLTAVGAKRTRATTVSSSLEATRSAKATASGDAGANRSDARPPVRTVAGGKGGSLLVVAIPVARGSDDGVFSGPVRTSCVASPLIISRLEATKLGDNDSCARGSRCRSSMLCSTCCSDCGSAIWAVYPTIYWTSR